MVSLDNLTVQYRRHPALHHVSGSFGAGSLTAVVGPNGAGKSTLLKCIAGLQSAAGGTLAIALPCARLAYLPQVFELDRAFPIDVRDCVLLGHWARCGAWGQVTRPLLDRVDVALRAVGLMGFERRSIGSLSSGQLQRALFARLVVQDADLILLDEPFNAVDARTTEALLALVRQWHQAGKTVIAVLHDHAQVHTHFPQTLLLAREVVAWGASADVLAEPQLRRARAMAEAWDASADICRADDALPGNEVVPSW